MKHNNPAGVAFGATLADAYVKADLADHIAAFGGCVAVNRPVDRATAEAIAERYAEVVVAPEYEEGTVDILSGRKNLRIMRIGNIARLQIYRRALRRLQEPHRRRDHRAALVRAPDPGRGGSAFAESVTQGADLQGGARADTRRDRRHALRLDGRGGRDLQLGALRQGRRHGGHRCGRAGSGRRRRDRAGQGYRNMAERLAYTRHQKSYRFLAPDLQAEIDVEVAGRARRAQGRRDGLRRLLPLPRWRGRWA